MSHLVTQAVPVAHSLGWPPARLAPGPHARGRGSSSGCGDWTASALDSPPCSPCGRPASSSTAGGAGCAGPGGTLARSSDTCVVFAWSSAGILQPPMMRTSTPDRDVGRRRAEEDEEALTGSFSKKTPPKKTAVSDRWNHYTFKPVLAQGAARTTGPAPKAASKRCNIKGNISHNSGRRIYHMPGDRDYARTRISPSRGERWFCSEAEARAAGWRRAGR